MQSKFFITNNNLKLLKHTMSKISTLSLIFGLSSGIFFNLANANTKEMKGDKMENKKEMKGGKMENKKEMKGGKMENKKENDKMKKKESDKKKKGGKDTKKKMQEEKKY